MQEFIDLATSKLGIGGDVAKSATGGLLGLIKDNADGADFRALADKLPGAAALANTPAAAASGGGLGGMLGSVTGALGGSGGALGALSSLAGSGLSLDKIGDFAKLFLNFAKPKLGADLLGRIASKVPGLANLMG
jgi:hypothetical protein